VKDVRKGKEHSNSMHLSLVPLTTLFKFNATIKDIISSLSLIK
jgi:hypothetical protein